MKKNLVALVMLFSSILALGMSAPARAEGTLSRNNIGPSVIFGGGATLFAVDSKFGVSDNLSLRPFVAFGNGATLFGGAVTYDFNLSNSAGGGTLGERTQVTPFVGGGVVIASGGSNNTLGYFTGGADFSVTENVDLKAELDIPFTGGTTSTLVRLGAGFKF
jgi:opacity protein-like surface antigen